VYSHLGAFIIIIIIINIFVKRHRQSYRGASNTYHTVNTKRYPSSQNEKIIINILLIRGILVRVILYPDMLYYLLVWQIQRTDFINSGISKKLFFICTQKLKETEAEVMVTIVSLESNSSLNVRSRLANRQNLEFVISLLLHYRHVSQYTLCPEKSAPTPLSRVQ